MPKNFDKTFMRRKKNRSPGKGIIGPKDFDCQRLVVSKSPPPYVSNPSVSRVVRLTFDYSAATGAAIVFSITPTGLSLADQLNYGATAVRYANMRTTAIRIWGTANILDFGATLVAGGPPLSFSVQDGVSNTSYEDFMQPGVDYATVGMRASLQQRSTWISTTGVATQFQITIISSNPVANPSTGKIVADVTVEFR